MRAARHFSFCSSYSRALAWRSCHAGLQRARKPGAAVTETARHGACDTTAATDTPAIQAIGVPRGNLHNGPFETERKTRTAAHEVVRPEPGWSILRKSQDRFVIERACEAAGVELGAYDRQILDWLSSFEDSVCGVIAGWSPARSLPPAPGRTVSRST
jgi:hypothetical protein